MSKKWRWPTIGVVAVAEIVQGIEGGPGFFPFGRIPDHGANSGPFFHQGFLCLQEGGYRQSGKSIAKVVLRSPKRKCQGESCWGSDSMERAKHTGRQERLTLLESRSCAPGSASFPEAAGASKGYLHKSGG